MWPSSVNLWGSRQCGQRVTVSMHGLPFLARPPASCVTPNILLGLFVLSLPLSSILMVHTGGLTAKPCLCCLSTVPALRLIVAVSVGQPCWGVSHSGMWGWQLSWGLLCGTWKLELWGIRSIHSCLFFLFCFPAFFFPFYSLGSPGF